MPPSRFPKNVPGPFYTTGECLACGAPEHEAPTCLAPLDDDNGDTYFVRQPETAEELAGVISAMHSCCVSAIRYGGEDPQIIRRCGNTSEYCDHVLPGGPARLSWQTDDQWQ